MKIAFAVYHDIKTECRTQRILSVLKKIGEVTFLSYSDPTDCGHTDFVLTGKGKKKYGAFLWETACYLRKNRKQIDVVVLHDNYCALLLWFVKIFVKPKKVVYDSSEFYLYEKENNGRRQLAKLVANLLVFFETHLLKKADIVIAANKERATLMKKYFKLSEMPMVFGNIHKINDPVNEVECLEKYGAAFADDKFTVIYAGGVLRDRLTKELAQAVTDLGDEYRLLVAGLLDEEYYQEIRAAIQNNPNVQYIGFVSRAELRYLFEHGDVGVSFFAMEPPNNRFCASGKIYECLFCGTPILTSQNPPLKRLCKQHGVGVSVTPDKIKDGIRELKENKENYRARVAEYIKNIDPADMEIQFANELKKQLI